MTGVDELAWRVVHHLTNSACFITKGCSNSNAQYWFAIGLLIVTSVCLDVRAVWHVSRVVSGIRANTDSDVWLLRRHRAHKRLRAVKVPRFCACGLRLLSAAVLI